MTLIKKIIAWIINLFKHIFSSKTNVKKTVLPKNDINKLDNKKRKLNDGIFNDNIPPYLIISNQDKELLINNINKLKQILINNTSKEIIIEKITQILGDSLEGQSLNKIKTQLNKEDFSKLSVSKLKGVLKEFNVDNEKINNVVNDIAMQKESIEKKVSNINYLLEYVDENGISIIGKDAINNELNKDITIIFNKDIINVIKDWNKSIVNDVMLEYEQVNYVTVSTTLIDKIIEKYKNIEDDYHHHRYNKNYYNQELNKLKAQITYLQDIKNRHDVDVEIKELRKQLYSKSKDKYDLLYNNEIFMNINNKCDELLKNINQRIVDIKNNSKNIIEKQENQQQEDYLQKILLRFKDIELAKQLILFSQNKDIDLNNKLLYIDSIYKEFLVGIDEPFNFNRNKAKTELVKLYNDLNKVIYSIKKESYIIVEHINFRMEDLIDAVIVKKNELCSVCPREKDLNNSELVNKKIEKMKKKYLERNKKELVKKLYNQ